MSNPRFLSCLLAAGALTLPVTGCTAPPAPAESPATAVDSQPAASAVPGRLLTTVRGLSGPEAVRYDPEQDVHFVANWGGDPAVADNNGFISRVRPDGSIDSLRFIAGGRGGATLHSPRGMYIVADTLWVADLDAVRGFDRRTGAPVAQIDFSGENPGFLNDIATGPDGALYLTDTGRNRIYRIEGRRFSVALQDSVLNRPNGITWDASRGRFIVVPIGGSHQIYAWQPGSDRLEPVGTSTGSLFDGVEVLPGRGILVASQADSSLHLFRDGTSRMVARTAGRPADIGVDTRRGRVAVPFVALDAVEIWELPEP